jgi:hypothetical protein
MGEALSRRKHFPAFSIAIPWKMLIDNLYHFYHVYGNIVYPRFKEAQDD